MRRLGKVLISPELWWNYDAMRSLTESLLIRRVDHQLFADIYEVVLEGPAFDEIADNEVIPMYQVTVYRIYNKVIPYFTREGWQSGLLHPA